MCINKNVQVQALSLNNNVQLQALCINKNVQVQNLEHSCQSLGQIEQGEKIDMKIKPLFFQN